MGMAEIGTRMSLEEFKNKINHLEEQVRNAPDTSVVGKESFLKNFKNLNPSIINRINECDRFIIIGTPGKQNFKGIAIRFEEKEGLGHIVTINAKIDGTVQSVSWEKSEKTTEDAPKIEEMLDPRIQNDAIVKVLLESKLPPDKLDAKIKELNAACEEIAKATGKSAEMAFDALRNPDIAAAFAKDPVLITNNFKEIVGMAFDALRNPDIAAAFAKDPVLITNKFKEIAEETGLYSRFAFDALRNPDIAAAFAKDPVLITNNFKEIVGMAFDALRNPDIAAAFAKDPVLITNKFKEIIKATDFTGMAFDALRNPDIAAAFAKDPVLITNKFIEIINASRGFVLVAFDILHKPEIGKLFLDYGDKKISFDNLMINIYSYRNFAIELGRPIDDLHDNEKERMKYLNSLTDLQVFGLLLSNPELFYTSSNHLLFDRLKNYLKKNNKTITDLFNEFDLFGTEQARNFLFRAINYDRLYGRENSLLKAEELGKMMDTLLSPLSSNKFDDKYFYLLANGLEGIKKVETIRKSLISKINDRLNSLAKKEQTEDIKKIKSALEFLSYMFNPNTTLISDENKNRIKQLEQKAVFIPEYYKNDGKLTIIQVFDPNDTKNDHWIYTQQGFRKYAVPKDENGKAITEIKKDPGTLIYETKDMKVILFMGETEEKNQEFIKQQLDKAPNLIITFRGHSFSLNKSFPPDIFGNRNSHILFIPGSCGSAGSVPEYITKNPNTDIKTFSNTSTGRGQVTNAILDALIRESRKGSGRRFGAILKENEKYIESNGGSVSTIKVFSPGEMLLRYTLGTDVLLAMR